MKEITFLKQNATKWDNYEKVMNEKNIGPSELTEMFIESTDDLSYANTNYKQSNTHSYVNNLASRVHLLVYKNRKEDGNRFIYFYFRELPEMFALHHKKLFYSFLVFGLATFLGVVSQIYDESFVRLILGDYYVDSTIERIKLGNPLGIYGEGNEFYSFVWITKNNIQVSFTAFILGVFTFFGTSYFLVYNGIMLGCFFTMFYQYNLLDKAFKVIWIHGTFEISAIIIAGCAGFILGSSFLFPGTYTRKQAFLSAAKSGIKIIIGLLPFFIVAGFLEGFVTRHTEMHWALSAFIIFSSLAFTIFYFVVLPIVLNRSTSQRKLYE